MKYLSTSHLTRLPHGRWSVVAFVGVLSGIVGISAGYGASSQEELRFASTELRLRETPAADGSVILTLPNAARLFVANCAEGWCRVRYCHENPSTLRPVESVGFAAQAYLSRDRPGTSSQAQPASSPSCFKICRKGQACGNSCISRSYTCRKGPGCASGYTSKPSGSLVRRGR